MRKDWYHIILTNPIKTSFLHFSVGAFVIFMLGGIFYFFRHEEINVAFYISIPFGIGILGYVISSIIKDHNKSIEETLSKHIQENKELEFIAIELGNSKADELIEALSDTPLKTALDVAQKKLKKQLFDQSKSVWEEDQIHAYFELIRQDNCLIKIAENIVEHSSTLLRLKYCALYYADLKNQNRYDLAACYAFDRFMYPEISFEVGADWKSQAIQEKHHFISDNTPADYYPVSSLNSEEPNPKNIFILPLITGEKVIAIIEFGKNSAFHEDDVMLLEKIGAELGYPLLTRLNNKHKEYLLEESNKLTEELRHQQQRLEEGAIEMREKSEEVERINIKLEEQVQHINNLQFRQNTLLENASELILVYDAQKTLRYLSPSLKRILGYETFELEGMNDFHNVDAQGRLAFESLFEQLLAHPHRSVTIRYTYKKKNESYIWLEATGRNFLHHPAIAGIVLNTRDITQERVAEKEQEMRGKMQALSENSHDLIIRFGKNNKFLYVNPMVSKYAGLERKAFKKTTLGQIDIEASFKKEIEHLLANVRESKRVEKRHFDYLDKAGRNIVFEANTIPEKGEDGSIETILMVLHDITEQKKQERLVRESSNKIKESIQYSHRIQTAIIPRIDEINKELPESFMFYKSKDVVSGDFPWYSKQGDNIYFAAVDCTGHGVPGAMMSLIGHLLLNDILNSHEDIDPASILNMLHKKVVATLKQEEFHTNTSDGMDIALIKINKANKTLEFSGAHRPLYHISNGNLTQLKGDRFPIGGTQYKGLNSFTNNLINYQTGDTFFLYSDGYTDQFGGEKNRKYGLKRLRNLLLDNDMFSMQDLEKIIEEDFLTWKGNNKQTDDIIFIGLKL